MIRPYVNLGLHIVDSIGIYGSVDLPNSGDCGSPIEGRQLFRIGRKYSKAKFPDDEIIIGPKFFKRQVSTRLFGDNRSSTGLR